MDNVLLYFSLKYQGEWPLIYNALDEKEKIESKDLIKINSTIPNNFISIINPLYPSSLKKVAEPSFVLYFKGCVSLMHNHHKTVGFVGGDITNKYNKEAALKIAKELIEENRTILLSDDTPIQEMILDLIIKEKAKVILTTKMPLEKYLKESKLTKKNLEETDYLIVSENEFSSAFENSSIWRETLNFKITNALSKAIVLLETKKSEELENYIKFTIEDDKKMFAIPQPIIGDNSNNNAIIKQKAHLIDSALDILNQI